MTPPIPDRYDHPESNREEVSSMEATINPSETIKAFLERRDNDMARVRADILASGIPPRQLPGILAWIRGEITPNKNSVTAYRRILDEIDGRPRAGAGRPREGDPLAAHNPRDARRGRGYVRRRRGGGWWNLRGAARHQAAAAAVVGGEP